jgi:hypothetical protein
VSSIDVPPFEVLTDVESPYAGFGPAVESDEASSSFAAVVSEAAHRVHEVFGVEPEYSRAGVAALEELISRMWKEGWDPEKAEINLFVRDLGSLFMRAIQAALGGEAIFRSPTDLSHASVWWRAARVEAFPFHRMYKRLSENEGGSLVFFFDSLISRVRI